MHAVILGHTAPRGRWSLNGSAMATKGDVLATYLYNVVTLVGAAARRCCRGWLVGMVASVAFASSFSQQISVVVASAGRGRNLCREGDFFVLRKPNPFEGNGWICRLACHNHAHVTPLFSLTPPAPLLVVIARPCAFTQILQSLRPADPRPLDLTFYNHALEQSSIRILLPDSFPQFR